MQKLWNFGESLSRECIVRFPQRRPSTGVSRFTNNFSWWKLPQLPLSMIWLFPFATFRSVNFQFHYLVFWILLRSWHQMALSLESRWCEKMIMAYTGEFECFFFFLQNRSLWTFLLVFVTNCMKLVSAISFTSCLTKILLHEAYKIKVLHKNSPQVTLKHILQILISWCSDACLWSDQTSKMELFLWKLLTSKNR